MSLSGFDLHPRLAADTALVADWALCRVLLMNDANFPWLILVPRRPGLRDFDDVAIDDRPAYLDEINRASKILRAMTGADKMNVAALGNMVPQLHVHVIARFEGDGAWPGPVWGVLPPTPYEDSKIRELIKEFNTYKDAES